MRQDGIEEGLPLRIVHLARGHDKLVMNFFAKTADITPYVNVIWGVGQDKMGLFILEHRIIGAGLQCVTADHPVRVQHPDVA